MENNQTYTKRSTVTVNFNEDNTVTLNIIITGIEDTLSYTSDVSTMSEFQQGAFIAGLKDRVSNRISATRSDDINLLPQLTYKAVASELAEWNKGIYRARCSKTKIKTLKRLSLPNILAIAYSEQFPNQELTSENLDSIKANVDLLAKVYEDFEDLDAVAKRAKTKSVRKLIAGIVYIS